MKKFFAVFMFLICFGAINTLAAEVPVLMYHSVDDTGGMYAVTKEKLASDVKGLKEAGYTTVSFKELIAHVYQGAPLPEKPVVITLDDGYENNFTTLLPLAEELDFKYEVFAVAGFINYGEMAMTWEELKQLWESENASVGCHTYNLHSYQGDGRQGFIRKEGESFRDFEHALRYDLYMAKKLFTDNIGRVPCTFAYPYGRFEAHSERFLRENGYLVTVTTEPGINIVTEGDYESLYLMMRISMDGQTASAVDMIKTCQGIYSSEKITRERMKVWDELNATRKEALAVLYGEELKDEEYNLQFIAPFEDLYYEESVTQIFFAKCVQKGVISGFPDKTMRPDYYITRGEFATLLARMTGFEGQKATHYFTDSKEWNADVLSWCYENGYMIGYGDLFGADDFMTKEQIEIVYNRIEEKEAE